MSVALYLDVHQLEVTIGQMIQDLEIIAKLGEADEVANRVQYLPL